MGHVESWPLADLSLSYPFGGALRDRLEVTSAADSESLTWGAIDPTWSPDGKRLGFSLFGSIWEVSSQGGEARQLTASAGYHAHPAWSPKGDQIVYVNGSEPRGRIPNISGELGLVDIETGREQLLKTPYPTAGALIHRIDVAGWLGGDLLSGRGERQG